MGHYVLNVQDNDSATLKAIKQNVLGKHIQQKKIAKILCEFSGVR